MRAKTRSGALARGRRARTAPPKFYLQENVCIRKVGYLKAGK